MVTRKTYRLNVATREQLSDARLILESAAYNAAILVRHQGDLSDEQLQALRNSATQVAQAAAALKRIERSFR